MQNQGAQPVKPFAFVLILCTLLLFDYSTYSAGAFVICGAQGQDFVCSCIWLVSIKASTKSLCRIKVHNLSNLLHLYVLILCTLLLFDYSTYSAGAFVICGAQGQDFVCSCIWLVSIKASIKSLFRIKVHNLPNLLYLC